MAQVELARLQEMPLRQTNDSYAKVFDAYVPVDEVDGNDQPIKKIATLRTLIYFEDLGPIEKLRERGFDLKKFIEDVEPDYPV